jgi:hypothetical protein
MLSTGLRTEVIHSFSCLPKHFLYSIFGQVSFFDVLEQQSELAIAQYCFHDLQVQGELIEIGWFEIDITFFNVCLFQSLSLMLTFTDK